MKCIKMDWEYLNNLRFVDDIVFIADNLEEFWEPIEAIGFHMNFKSTQIMTNNKVNLNSSYRNRTNQGKTKGQIMTNNKVNLNSSYHNRTNQGKTKGQIMTNNKVKLNSSYHNRTNQGKTKGQIMTNNKVNLNSWIKVHTTIT